MPEITARGERLKDAVADGFVAADERTNTKRAAFSKRMLALLQSTEGRDAELFTRAGAPNLTLQQAASPDNPTRDRDMNAITAAAQRQAFIEVLARDLLTSADKHSKSVDKARKGLGRGEMVVAAVEGVTKGHMDAAKKRRANGSS